MTYELYKAACDTIADVENFAVVSDLKFEVNGTQIDVISLEPTWDGGNSFHFYSGNPQNEDEDYEELIISGEEEEHILKEFVDFF